MKGIQAKIMSARNARFATITEMPCQAITAQLPPTGRAFNVAGFGYLFGWGVTVPTVNNVYAPGALFFDLDATGANAVTLMNEGTLAAVDFQAITT